MPCHCPISWIYSPAPFPKWQNRKFSTCRALRKADWQSLYQEIATANTENGNSGAVGAVARLVGPADGVALLGRIAACLVWPLTLDLESLALSTTVRL
jgi:hypothetical protein